MSIEHQWIKPAEAAKRMGVSKPTMYRLLPRLAAEGVEIFKPAQRVTLIDVASFESWMQRQRWSGPGGEAILRGPGGKKS
jgi:hypothetical protein